jgi:hypothetical protein
MSEYTQGGARSGAPPLPFAVGNLGPVIETAARTSSAYSKAYLAWQDEILRFTSTRLQRDAEFGTELLKCDKWADAARLQQTWVTATVEDYVSEANRLFELATNLTSDVARTSSDNMRATADEARRTVGAAGEQARTQAGAMAEGMSRFGRSAGEQAGTAGETAAAMAEEGRKFGEDVASAAKERGPKRR